jgi:hypothetical protein
MDEVCIHIFDTEFISDGNEQIFDTEFVADEQTFDSEFHSVVSDVQPEEQEKTVTITENGTVEVLPDGDKLLNKVTVITDVISGDVDEYKGSYEVTPRLEEQTLPTALKVMRNDVKINKIPITKVSNTSGGNTVIIGG